jgi:hypothetical protein
MFITTFVQGSPNKIRLYRHITTHFWSQILRFPNPSVRSGAAIREHSLAIVKRAIDKRQLATHLPPIDLVRRKYMVLAEPLGDIVASPYQDHMNESTSSNEEEHAEHCELITCIEFLAADFPHRKAKSHECHRHPGKHPHNDKRLNCVGGESHFACEMPGGGRFLSNPWVLDEAEQRLCLSHGRRFHTEVRGVVRGYRGFMIERVRQRHGKMKHGVEDKEL